MFLTLRIVAVFTIILPHTIQQQFLEEGYLTCEFENLIDKKLITIPKKVWKVGGLNRHQDVVVKLSICNLPASIPDCDLEATVCTINKKKNRYIITNAGTSFIYTKDDSDANIFKSINGELCDGEERFTTIIEFNRYPDISLEPKFKFMSECELKIEIPDPDYEPPCTLKKHGNFIDMRSLKNIETNVEHPETKMKFSLNVCKNSPKCDPDVSICQLLDNGRSAAISDVSSQRLVLKEGSILIQGHTSESRRRRLEFILNLKCNWKATGLTNVVYVKPHQQGKTFRFSAESSVACVKLPINCLIRDTLNDNYLYDLRRLYRSGNGWNVKNVTSGRININMCGSLQFSDSTTECARQHSQVCLTKGGTINLGSIQKNIEVTSDDTVITSFTDGSACIINGIERSYSTEIEFICKAQEDGPIVHDIDGCVYRIKWYTPTACAKNLPIGDDCRVTDMTGPINLNPMRQYEDRTHTLSQNSFLRLNLCGPLNKPCNNNTAAVCLVNGNTEHVLGRTNLTVVKNDGIVSTIMKGDKCSGKMSELKINFRCNQFATPAGQVQVNIIRDFCDYEINVATPTACSPMSFYNCKLYNGNFLYDLLPLMRHDANYEIKQDGLLYSLNLCRSVVRTNNAQCTAYAGICIKNLTEMHEKKRYISLGMINNQIVPKLDNGDVVVEYKHGTLCPDDFSDRSSLIRFKCSETREEGPKLLIKTACHHEFLWITPKACLSKLSNPKTRAPPACLFADPVTKNIIDLAAINTNIEFERHNETINLSICSNKFTYCTLNYGLNCTMLDTDFQLESSSNGPSILYALFNRSCTNGAVNFVNISVSCEPTYSVNDVEVGKITNCTLYANLKTRHVCSKDVISKSVEIISSKPEIVRRTENKDCTIPELNHFSLTSLGNLKIFSMMNSSYAFNFDGKGDCNGLVCKDGSSMGPEVNLCPLTQIDDLESSVQLVYRSKVCLDDFFRSEILLKCDENSAPRIVKETDCSVVIRYPFKEVCTWFPQSGQLQVSSADSTGVAVGSSVGVLILLALVGGGIFVLKKRGMQRKASYETISSDKRRLHVYCKNAEL